MSLVLDGTKGVSASGGLYAANTFTGTYTDGIVVDYITGNGRISVGAADGLTFYNGGVAATALAQIDTSGNLNFKQNNAGIVFQNSSALTNSTLNDYETGTWSVADNSGAGLSITTSFAQYTKIGNMVFAACDITYPVTANGNSAAFSMPFIGVQYANAYVGYTNYTTTAIYFENGVNSANMNILNSSFSGLTNANISGKRFIVTMVYKTSF